MKRLKGSQDHSWLKGQERLPGGEILEVGLENGWDFEEWVGSGKSVFSAEEMVCYRCKGQATGSLGNIQISSWHSVTLSRGVGVVGLSLEAQNSLSLIPHEALERPKVLRWRRTSKIHP